MKTELKYIPTGINDFGAEWWYITSNSHGDEAVTFFPVKPTKRMLRHVNKWFRYHWPESKK